MNKYDTLNKTILYTVNRYIEESIKDGLEPSELHHRIKSSSKVFMTFNEFTDKDIVKLTEIAKDESFKNIISTQVSFLVYTLELMKQWVEEVPKENRPYLKISDKKLKTGRAMFAISMLKLKQRDEEKHKELSSIIQDSVVAAKHFFGYHMNKLVA